MLRVTSELRHNAGTIYFEDGTIIFAEIRSNPHPLGALLLRTGKITEADLERARDMQQRQGDSRRLGEILVSLGALTRRELQRQVRFQIEEVVFEVMSWREGYFSFTEGPLSDVATETAVRIPTEALLMEGARRIDEWSRIEGRIPHLGVVPMLAPPQETGEGELDLLPPEWEMLAMINGVRDVRAIASELGRSDFEVAKILFGLESAGVIVLADPGTTKRERTTLAADLAELVARAEDALARRDLEEARGVAEQAAGVHPHDPAVHLLLGRIALASGRSVDAVEELRRALRLDPLAVAAYRVLGYALVGTGRFGEAVEQWDQWERLAARSETELAQDPDSLVFLRLGELLRHKGQLDTAHRVALTGLERHPHLPDAHDLYARILADKHDYERAFDEWDMALRIAPDHVGALKGLAFLYFKIGDVQQAAAHLEAAQRVAPDDPGVAQALAMARGGGPGGGGAEAVAGGGATEALTAPEPIAPAAQPLEEARVFAGLEGAQEGLLLLDSSGRVLGGALKDPSGRDVTDAVAAYLAGVSQEAARTVKLLGLGRWTGLAAEGSL